MANLIKEDSREKKSRFTHIEKLQYGQDDEKITAQVITLIYYDKRKNVMEKLSWPIYKICIMMYIKKPSMFF